MLKKIIDTLKTMLLVLACILVPLLIGMYFVQNSAKDDAVGCIETFIQDEGTGLAKYITLQLEGAGNYIGEVCSEVADLKLTDDNQKKVQEQLDKIAQKDDNIVSINLYNANGGFVTSSVADEDPEDDLDMQDDKYKDLNNKFVFYLDQLDDGATVAKFITEEEINDQKMFVEVTVKWAKYETYMMGLKAGSFPRMFYILSPDCGRYVSLHSLPEASASLQTSIALGLHLAKKQGEIEPGLSTIKIERHPFKVFREEIQMPSNLIAKPMSVVIVTDDGTVESMLTTLTESIPSIILLMFSVWLMLCIVLARFYTKTKEQLDIATTISKSTPLAIAIFRVSDGKVIQINMSALALFKIEKQSVDQINMWKLFLYDDDKKYVENAISSSVNVLNYEVLAQSFTGGAFWTVCSASGIEIEEEMCVILAIIDINRRKEIEKKLANNAALLESQIKERTADLEIKAKELEESNALLEKSRSIADEANAAKTKFLANMSNELKTPINAIIGYSEILEEEAMDRKDTVTADDLHKIISSAKHLLSLIDEILDLSSIESGKTQLFFENFEVKNLIKDIESVAMPLVTNNDNSLFLEIGKTVGSMYTDATKLRQCLLNLLGNAAKFTQFGKITLRVTSLVKGGIDYVEFSVIDTGCGISPDRIENIFAAFQDNQTKSSGAGLGLSITKKYVDVLEGTITVESELGVGSKFTIRLPRKSTVVSSDTVVVKNQNDDTKEFDDEDILDDSASEIEETSYSLSGAETKSDGDGGSTTGNGSGNSSNGNGSFGRKSDI